MILRLYHFTVKEKPPPGQSLVQGEIQKPIAKVFTLMTMNKKDRAAASCFAG
jgi:hypothetical protein